MASCRCRRTRVSAYSGVHGAGSWHVVAISDSGDEILVGVSIHYIRSQEGEQLRVVVIDAEKLLPNIRNITWCLYSSSKCLSFRAANIRLPAVYHVQMTDNVQSVYMLKLACNVRHKDISGITFECLCSPWLQHVNIAKLTAPFYTSYFSPASWNVKKTATYVILVEVSLLFSRLYIDSEIPHGVLYVLFQYENRPVYCLCFDGYTENWNQVSIKALLEKVCSNQIWSLYPRVQANILDSVASSTCCD